MTLLLLAMLSGYDDMPREPGVHRLVLERDGEPSRALRGAYPSRA